MRNLVVFCFLILGYTNYCQDELRYTYSEHPKLTWEDFKAEPKTSSQFQANTNSGFSYSWSYSSNNGEMKLTYDVYSTFYPNRSWVDPEHKTAKLLAHEQLHFDISELHARKLLKALSEYKLGRNIRQDLKSIYTKIEKERIAMQQSFDKESNHSLNAEEEQRWQNFIAKELQNLEQFSIKN